MTQFWTESKTMDSITLNTRLWLGQPGVSDIIGVVI